MYQKLAELEGPLPQKSSIKMHLLAINNLYTANLTSTKVVLGALASFFFHPSKATGKKTATYKEALWWTE